MRRHAEETLGASSLPAGTHSEVLAGMGIMAEVRGKIAIVGSRRALKVRMAIHSPSQRLDLSAPARAGGGSFELEFMR